MPSLRQRMTTYLRQLSFVQGDGDTTANTARLNIDNKNRHRTGVGTSHQHQHSASGHAASSNNASSGSGCFVTQYLEGRLPSSLANNSSGTNDATVILHGKEPDDLPELRLHHHAISDVQTTVTAACTGPDDGLTGVRRSRLHLSAGPEIDFIDTAQEDADDDASLGVRPSTPPVLRPSRRTPLSLGQPQQPPTSDTNANQCVRQSMLTTTTTASPSLSTTTTQSTAKLTTIPGSKTPKNVTINIVVNTIRTSAAAAANPSTVNNNTVESPPDETTKPQLTTTTTTTTTTTMTIDGKSDAAAMVTTKDAVGHVEATTTATASSDDDDVIMVPVFAAVPNWRLENDHAYGLSVSLYEQNIVSGERVGDPIADCYGLVVRGPSAVMAMADGVNWGDGARLAARSAIQGCLEYLDTAIFGNSAVQRTAGCTTRDVFVSLLRSFWEAHSCILDVGGALSTLTACVVLPLETVVVANVVGSDSTAGERFVVCACNVGDSFGYVYSKRDGVREFTQGSHDISGMRDMRDALGALGPVQGNQPELGNLTLSLTYVEPGDIVFLTSDGISDNFDPVVGKFAEAKPMAAASASQQHAAQQQHQQQPPPLPQQQLAPKRQNRSTSAIQDKDRNQRSSVAFFSTKSSTDSSRRPTTQPAATDRQRPPLLTQKSAPGSDALLCKPIRPSSASTASAILSPQLSKNNAAVASHSGRPKFMRAHTVIEPRSAVARKMSARLPQVSGAQRHALTLLRLDDLLCYGINGTRHPCPSARKLCHLLVDFARMITAARRGMLEQRDLYYRLHVDPVTGVRSDVELTRLQQRAARKRAIESSMFAQLPGKLDHASVVAFTVERHRRAVGQQQAPVVAVAAVPSPMVPNVPTAGNRSRNIVTSQRRRRTVGAAETDL